MYCKFCGKNTPKDTVDCIHCGETLNKECPLCAEIVRLKAQKCRFCQHEFEKTRRKNLAKKEIDRSRKKDNKEFNVNNKGSTFPTNSNVQVGEDDGEKGINSQKNFNFITKNLNRKLFHKVGLGLFIALLIALLISSYLYPRSINYETRRPLTDIEFSSNGKYIIYSIGKTAFIRNTLTGFDHIRLDGLGGELHKVIFSPNNRWAATAGEEGTIDIWDIEKGKHLKTLDDHTGAITDIAFSPAGELLVSGSYDGIVRIWDIEKGMVVRRLNPNLSQMKPGYISALALSSNSKYVAAIYPKLNEIIVWETKGSSIITQFKSSYFPNRNKYELVFSQDNEYLILPWNNEDKLMKYPVKKNKVFSIYHDPSKNVNDIEISHDGELLFSSSENHGFMITNMPDQNIIHTKAYNFIEESEVNCISYLRLENKPSVFYVVTGNNDGTIRVWNGQNGKLIKINNAIVNRVEFWRFQKLLKNYQVSIENNIRAEQEQNYPLPSYTPSYTPTNTSTATPSRTPPPTATSTPTIPPAVLTSQAYSATRTAQSEKATETAEAFSIKRTATVRARQTELAYSKPPSGEYCEEKSFVVVCVGNFDYRNNIYPYSTNQNDHFVVFAVNVGTAGVSHSTNPNNLTLIMDDNSQYIYHEATFAFSNHFTSMTVYPDQVAKGVIAFRVNKNSRPEKIIYDLGLFSGDIVIELD